MTDMIVSGAGTSAANGTYAFQGVHAWNNKPYYKKSNQELIEWDFTGNGHTWEIVGFDEDEFEDVVFYYTDDDVATPDLVTTWVLEDGSSPAPTVTAASSSQNLTLTCAAGSYSLTGTNVTLTATVKQNLTLACNAGSYTLTGSDVDFVLQRNYSLECGAGSYSLTGTNVLFEVKRNYVLTCAAGSYSLTGTNADPIMAHTWSETQPAGDENKNWYTSAMSDDGSVIIAGNSLRLYLSTNSGTSWAEVQPAGDANKS